MRQPDAEDAANSKRGRASGFWETCSEKRQAICQITERDVLASGECCREKDTLYEEGNLSGQWDRERDGLFSSWMVRSSLAPKTLSKDLNKVRTDKPSGKAKGKQRSRHSEEVGMS